MNQTLGWIIFRFFASLLLACTSGVGMCFAFIGHEPLIGAMAVVIVLLATAWQWDRDQTTEVDRAEQRHNFIQHAKDEWRKTSVAPMGEEGQSQ